MNAAGLLGRPPRGSALRDLPPRGSALRGLPPRGSALRDQSWRVLATRARSFRWAALFLPAALRDDAALLYAFCRRVDDAVDGPDADGAPAALLRIRAGLEGGAAAAGDGELLSAFCALSRRRGVPRQAARQLIDGAESDLGPVWVPDDPALLRYCYQVAGTVGLMMCGLLGIRAPAARAHAIDLGIAMQLTNICRDVREDAERGRVYLPATRLAQAGLSQDEVLAGRAGRRALAAVVAGLLDLADRYYASAELGMRMIPPRARLAILIASRLYRAIGLRLRRRFGCDPLVGRAVVPPLHKLAWLLAAVLAWLRSLSPRPRPAHDASLHAPLAGLLPGSS